MAVTVSDLYRCIDALAPFETQCAWDNSGLLIGDGAQPVTKAAFVLDITPEAVAAAAAANADVIISHHPVIFHAKKRLPTHDPAYLLARHGLAAICAHTALDKARGGVNDALAAALGFADATPFASTGEAAMLRVCTLPETDAKALAAHAAAKLHGAVRLADSGRPIRTVALCGGAGAEFLEDVAAAGLDALLTGDAAHHEFLLAKELGVSLLAAGHFETEQPVVAVLEAQIRAQFEIETVILPQTAPQSTII